MSILIRAGVVGVLLWGLHIPIGGALKLGPVFDPVDGVWGTARSATPHTSGTLSLEGMMEEVTVELDERGVPHIFASSDQDAIMALGYLVARDRLFQMDFIHRAATGTLSEMLGESALSTDRFFLRNGITDAVQRNSELLGERLPRELDAVQWYGQGVNAYLTEMTPAEIPLEYKILGATPPKGFSTSYTMALFAFMTYDLSFQNQDVQTEALKTALGEIDFESLYPQFGTFEKTIVQPEERHWGAARLSSNRGKLNNSRDQTVASADKAVSVDQVVSADKAVSEDQVVSAGKAVSEDQAAADQAVALNGPDRATTQRGQADVFTAPTDIVDGFFDGKGSNNWAVNGSKSATGMPILAGDMHLGLTLPAIWYEAHLVTPTANVYGVTFPSVPGIVEGITPTTAWAFTNTGSDQIDTFRMKLNADRDAYLYDNEWRPLEVIQDTLRVKGKPELIETRYASHLGPILSDETGDYAIKWVGHEFGTTFAAIWEMNRATDYPSFEQAIQKWDYPMQNILYAGADSVIAIRSTGYMPVRAQGYAFGVQDGSTSSTAWTGRVPFEDLPHVISPDRDFLTSTNQRPAADGYPYYLDADWRSVYRSMRIYNLLSDKEKHSVSDLKNYQADVTAVQASLFLPLIQDLDGLTSSGERLRAALQGFDGNMDLESEEAQLFVWFMDALNQNMWDEDVFDGRIKPKEIRILDLIERQDEKWFDLVDTPNVESKKDFLRVVVNAAGAMWESEQFASEPFGENHGLVLRHITRSEALSPLWKGPYPFPGYVETLSPAGSNPVHWSASWRVVVDFSTSPPSAFGVYPGGQSGNPFSNHYDAHVEKYVSFDYYPLDLKASPGGF